MVEYFKFVSSLSQAEPKMLHWVFVLFSTIMVAYLIQHFRNWMIKFNLINKIPGPKAYPVIGNAPLLVKLHRKKKIEFAKAQQDKYGNLTRLWFGSLPVVSVKDADDMEIILSSRVNIQKSFIYTFFEPWLGTGLLTSTGSKWHKRRKMLTPAFHFNILETFLPVLVENCQVFTEKLAEMVNKNDFDVFPFISKCTLDVICETAMGVKLNLQKSETPEYLNSVGKMNEIIGYKIVRPWLWNRYLYSLTKTYETETEALSTLHSMSLNIIRTRRAEREKNGSQESNDYASEDGGKRRKAFLDLLLDILQESPTDEMDDEDIREEVDTFMFEGHDTTATSLAMIIFAVATNPDVQEKLAEELYSVFGDSDQAPTLNDIKQLKYLERVIKESLRMYPPVPQFGRTLAQDVTLMRGKYVVPAGTMLELNIFRMQRSAEYFPNPSKFNPDNFLPENSQKRPPFAYVPFSAGPRNCIGQKFATLEEKVIISSLFRKFEVKSVETEAQLGLVPESILRPDNGVHVQILPRVWKA